MNNNMTEYKNIDRGDTDEGDINRYILTRE